MELIRPGVLKFTGLQPIPEKFTMVNQVSTTSAPKKTDPCQPGFTYFKQGNTPSPYWGSSRPIAEKCPTNFTPHTGVPSHSLGNNMTKRKSVVEGTK